MGNTERAAESEISAFGRSDNTGWEEAGRQFGTVAFVCSGVELLHKESLAGDSAADTLSERSSHFVNRFIILENSWNKALIHQQKKIYYKKYFYVIFKIF